MIELTHRFFSIKHVEDFLQQRCNIKLVDFIIEGFGGALESFYSYYDKVKVTTKIYI